MYAENPEITFTEVLDAWLAKPRVEFDQLQDSYFWGKGRYQDRLTFIEEDGPQDAGDAIPRAHRVALDVYKAFDKLAFELYEYGWCRGRTKLRAYPQFSSELPATLNISAGQLRSFQRLISWLRKFQEALHENDLTELQHMANGFDDTFGLLVVTVHDILTRDNPRRLPRALARAPSHEDILQTFLEDDAALD